MRSILSTGMILILGILVSESRMQAQDLDLHLGEPLEIGQEDLLFGSVTAVCEDEAGNFYVVDQLEHKVYTFSRDGKLLYSFGQQGQGPGDFLRPNRISLTSQGHLAVADEMYTISFLKRDGTFLKRVKLDTGLAPGYMGEDRFYAWRWVPEGQQQIMLDAESRILKTFHTVSRDRFSVSAPDQSGREVMFNYARPAFSPGLMYAQSGGLTAVAISDTYRIQLLDQKGEARTVIERQVEPQVLSRAEQRHFEDEFQEFGKMRGWPESVVRDIIGKLPRTKVLFDRILLSPAHVLVCRVPSDITADAAFPVDIFTTGGKYLGPGSLPKKPLFVSQSRMYFERSDADGNVWLVVRGYSFGAIS
ncbi:MAG: 6-bladed beta-propeller [Candidatus Aminicenantaceae bacterium]